MWWNPLERSDRLGKPRRIRGALVSAVLVLGVSGVGCGARVALTRTDAGGAEEQRDSSTGGTFATGGAFATGGTFATGGIFAMGGASSTGGIFATGGAPPATCSALPIVLPCGGDVVGEWTVSPGCLRISGTRSIATLGIGCATVEVTGVLQVSGFIRFESTGAYVDKTLTTGEETLELRPSCLEGGNTLVSCVEIARFLQLILGYETLRCFDGPSEGCQCAGTIRQVGSLGALTPEPLTNGPLSTTADRLSMGIDPATGEPAGYAYCRQGNELRLTPRLESPYTTGAIVLTQGNN